MVCYAFDSYVYTFIYSQRSFDSRVWFGVAAIVRFVRRRRNGLGDTCKTPRAAQAGGALWER